MNNSKSIIHEKSYKFSLDIIQFCEDLPNKRVFWIISDQLLRSATSIGANIIEAKASSSRRDFVKFYQIALKSANEADYWLNLLNDSKLDIDTKQINGLLTDLLPICKILGKSLITMKGRKR